jgi:hypothetical protein
VSTVSRDNSARYLTDWGDEVVDEARDLSPPTKKVELSGERVSVLREFWETSECDFETPLYILLSTFFTRSLYIRLSLCISPGQAINFTSLLL